MKKMKQPNQTTLFEEATQATAVMNIPIAKLRFGNYQRTCDKKRVKKIFETFDPHRMRPIEVSFRDGFYWVYDGRHRVESYILRGEKTIPCQVHYGLSYEDEARLFAEQQENVGQIYLYHKWKAWLEASDPRVMKIIEIANSYGYEINPTNKNTANRVSAVKVILEIVEELSFEGLDTILNITRQWSGSHETTDGKILNGLKAFFTLYGNEKNFNEERLIKQLKKIEPINLLSQADCEIDIKTKALKVAKVMFKKYNDRLCDSNKLPYKFNF